MANNSRTRSFNLLLYPDNTEHEKVLKMLTESVYSFVGICHDKDIYTEDSENHCAGELKKEHYHIIIKFENARTKSAVAKELEIDERFIDETKSFNSFSKYLLHRGEPDKYQYDTDELFGTLKNRVIKMLDVRTEDELALSVFDLLDSERRVISLTEFGRICASNGIYSCFRRAGSQMIRMIDEHNEIYRQSNA